MIRFNGFLHREDLTEVLGRILSAEDDTTATVREDTRALNRIVNFNAYCGCLILDAFAHSLFGRLHGGPVVSSSVQTKGALKDSLVRDLADLTPRTADLASRYRRQPQDYYRETPFNGRVYRLCDASNRLLGVSRVKRFRRIAEKASRYVIAAMDHPFSAKVPSQLPRGLIASPLNDILGLKMLCAVGDVDRVICTLGDMDDFSLVELESHTGTYTATHLSVRFRWPRKLVLELPPKNRALEILRSRGCVCDIATEYEDFVTTAEDEVLVEVILCTGEALLESEIGDSMHEERILAQRSDPQHRGVLARNIEYAIDYLFRFCVSPRSFMDEMPIRLSGRYMPDYIDQLQSRLLEGSAETDFTEACMCSGRYLKPPQGARRAPDGE